MAPTLTDVASPELLRTCWEDVESNDREDGVVGVGVGRFARDVDGHLETIHVSLTEDEYRPGFLTRVEIASDGGRSRLLHIPTVRDRIVERAVLSVLTPIVDPWLGAASYAYRPGLGVADAVQAVARLRDEGLRWVARADVDDCFPSIPVRRLQRMLDVLVEDAQLRLLLDGFLRRRSTGPGGKRPVRGLPQGSPLSPMFANLVLVHLDDHLLDAGFPVVRYGDDFTVLATNRDEAWEGMRMASEAVEELDMNLGGDKSQVMSFDDGFVFLGEDFGPRYPPALSDHRTPEPVRRTLYVGMDGSRLRIRAGRVVVQSPDDQEVLNVPSGQIERVVSFGSVGISAGTRTWALANGIDQVFLSRRGAYLGHARSGGDRSRVRRLRAQLDVTSDDARCLEFGQAVVDAKLRKQVVVLRRLVRRYNVETVSEATGQIGQLLPMIRDCSGRDELMGVEGAAARAYFEAMGTVMPEGLRFERRSRRPPQDVVNSALSYGYAILLGETVSALSAVGLDPAISLLHADVDRRPSLALDLMEEFRPLVVDQLVLAAVNRNELRPEHGRRESGVRGVLLTRAGRSVVLDGYEKRMLQVTRGALPGFTGSLRRHLYRQAERLAAFILDPAHTWTGLSWR